eukprot:3169067-Prorocentrum_lima.AAC.1
MATPQGEEGLLLAVLVVVVVSGTRELQARERDLLIGPVGLRVAQLRKVVLQQLPDGTADGQHPILPLFFGGSLQ